MKRFAIALVLLLPAGSALALTLLIWTYKVSGGPAAGDPPKLFTPKRGATIPPELTFRDSEGTLVTMGQFGHDRPFILAPVYFKCPRMCSQVLQDLGDVLRGMEYTVGKEFDVVVVSFDPNEPPALAKANKKRMVEEYARPGSESGWHFLTGTKDQIDGLLDAIGYRVEWDEAGGQFMHDAGIVICSPDGVVVDYLQGLNYQPAQLRGALVQASEGKIRRGVMEQVLMPCFRFDPNERGVRRIVLRTTQSAGVATLALIGALLLRAWLLPGRRSSPVGPPGAEATDTPSAAGDGQARQGE
jgi:protein SCO1/2